MDKDWFASRLLAWYKMQDRKLPWKESRDPYIIWLSEIILQQTRVQQGTPYFLKFVDRYPTVKDLANAEEQELFKLWEGLGYYNRARNLHHTAKYIAYELGGKFPNTYQGLLDLKGVGPYTAAAISAFAYDLPQAVVDGNVFRVLARVFDLDTPIDSGTGKMLFQELAMELLDENRSADYNQAIMDLGATVCTPRSPSCTDCPLGEQCLARSNSLIAERPVKKKKAARKDRFFQYFYLESGVFTWIRKRVEKDIWRNLYEFPLVETAGPVEEVGHLIKGLSFIHAENPVTLAGRTRVFKQTLSHQVIHATFWILQLEEDVELADSQFSRVERAALETYPWPRLFNWFFEDQTLSLELPFPKGD